MPHGGIPTIRHNEIRDITATLLTEICHNVATEPALQQLDSETFSYRSANSDPNAHLDIRARGFWNRGQDTFFDIRVFHLNASSNYSTTIATTYRKHEQAKKRKYAQRVRDVEHDVFTPLVFTTTGGMGREATTFYRRLADGISTKERKENSVVNGLDPMPPLIRNPALSYPCHPRKQILSPPPHSRDEHSSGND